MKENKFQSKLIKEIKEIFEYAIVLKNDPTYIQGIPDLLILWKDKWAALECKGSARSMVRPNQEYYVKELNDRSFARFVYPENKEEVMNELRKFFFGIRK